MFMRRAICPLVFAWLTSFATVRWVSVRLAQPNPPACGPAIVAMLTFGSFPRR
jgi:hypothetical protein